MKTALTGNKFEGEAGHPSGVISGSEQLRCQGNGGKRTCLPVFWGGMPPRWSSRGWLAVDVEMEAVSLGNSDHMTVKNPLETLTAPLAAFRCLGLPGLSPHLRSRQNSARKYICSPIVIRIHRT